LTASNSSLYYEEYGRGTPIIFIPGWTGTHKFFERQIPYFRQHYRVITFDPRSQGLSPSTLDHNTYEQHGKDLAHLIKKLKLKQIILVRWSFGCRDAYAYLRQQGTKNIKAFVCIDNAPKGVGKPNEWHSRGAAEGREYVSVSIEHDRYAFTRQLVYSMNDQKLTEKEARRWIDQMLQTPSYAALLLLNDASFTDYTKEAELLDKQRIPVLNVVASPYAFQASSWLKIHAPHAVLVTTWDKHMMFWEHSDVFNPMLDNFLKQHQDITVQD
jgi:non-heme chloroperoxidase